MFKENMIKKYFITFCSISKDNKEDLLSPVPADLKSKYVISRLGNGTHVISLSSSKRFGFGKRTKNDNTTFRSLLSFGTNSKICKFLDKIIRKIYLFFFATFIMQKDDKLLIYHSYLYTKYLSKVLRSKRNNAVLEVEEIYGFNAVEDKPYLKDEIYFIKSFPKFVFVNDYIPFELGINRLSYVVSYGVINKCSSPKRIGKDENHVVHILYAGTIEEKKRGAFYAAWAAKYLPGKYLLHIAGFGKQDSINKLLNIIKINNDENECKIVFHGMLTGSDLDNLMDMCDIGLSPNVMRPNFANNTFPSKTITYMLHNLRIVSGFAEAFSKCKICNDWIYYYTQEPQAIADAIKSVPLNNSVDNSALLNEIDNELISFFKTEHFI